MGETKFYARDVLARGVFIAALCAAPLNSFANPTGGQVASGAAAINTMPGSVLVNQSTGSAIINWQSFSIQSGESTRFIVPTSSSATLNRVLGGNASQIYGTLKSNGQLYLVNPNGIVVGSSGQIDTAGFVGSTLDVSNAEFNKLGDLNFSGTGGSIQNQGTISASNGGVYLIATQVDNSGSITAPSGTVGLAAGTQVLLQKQGDTHLFVQAGDTSNPRSIGVSNSGSIASAAAELRAAGGNAYALAINNSGNIAATGVANINGQVYLTSDGADITNSGVIKARQANGNGGKIVINAHGNKSKTKGTLLNSGAVAATGKTGGTVELLGDRVGVMDQGVVDVSGDTGGGTAHIGGDLHGANPEIPNADQTYIGPDATIKADALTLGNGGEIVAWGGESTQVYGNLSARGGPEGGNGGYVETSAPNLDVQMTPDVSAPKGKGGNWLLDPTDITIDDSVTTTPGYNAPFTVTAGPYDLNQADLLAALQSESVTIDASQGSGGSGNITWTQTGSQEFDIKNINGNLLTLDAPGTLSLTNITITSSNGNGSLDLILNDNNPPTGSVNVSGSTINVESGYFVASGGAGVTVSNSHITAKDIYLSSNSISVTGSTFTASDLFPATGSALTMADDDSSGLTGQITVTGSTLSSPSMLIGYDNAGEFNASPSQVNIDSSTVNLTPNPGGENHLYINGISANDGEAGVSITGNTSFTTGSGDIDIEGTGLYTNSDGYAVGVDIENSSFTIGTSGTPGTGQLYIHGYSDAGVTSDFLPEGFSDSAFGVEMISSNITSYSTGGGVRIKGKAFAADDTNAYGVYIDGGTMTVANGSEHFQGKVDSETFGDTSQGEAYFVNGVYTVGGVQFNATGPIATIDIEGDTSKTTATDNGDDSVHVRNTGVNLTDGTVVSAAGGSALGDGGILIGGEAGAAVADDTNNNETSSIGVWIHSDGEGAGGTVSVGGLGEIGIVGEGGNSTGPDAVSLGVSLGDTNDKTVSITAPGGGAIGIAGLGGTISAGASESFDGFNSGLFLRDAQITTTTGVIVLLGVSGGEVGVPEGSGISDGVFLYSSSTVSTNMTAAGAHSYNGVVIQPTIILYGTTGSYDSTTKLFTPNGFGSAVSESSDSSLIGDNLVMGNLYGLFTEYAMTSLLSQFTATTASNFNSFLTNHDISIDPSGLIDLSSTTNQISNLDAAWVGSGGLNFVDSVNLTVSTIGSSDNTNYGQIDGPTSGPVFIQTSGNLTLTNVPPDTGVPSGLPVIAVTGEGNTITLVTGGVFTNLDDTGVPALQTTGGASYIVYSNNVADDQLGNLTFTTFTTIFDTPYTGEGPSGSGNFFVFSGAPGTIVGSTPPGSGGSSPGNPNSPTQPVDNTLYTFRPITLIQTNSVTLGTQVVGGAGGVTSNDDLGGEHGHHHTWSPITQNDTKDGSTVNTGTLADKWAGNTGFSKIIRFGDQGIFSNGQIYPGGSNPFSFNLFYGQTRQQILDDLSHAAFEFGVGGHH